jgi:chromate transporter
MEKKKSSSKFLLEIFLSCFKISPLSFGGGFAMIPIMEQEVVYNKQWIEREQILDIFAVIQSLPGAIAVNAATLIGYQLAGLAGAIAAFLGILIPTFAIMVIFGAILVTYQHNLYVQAALQCIRPVVVAMIASAAFKMSKVSLVDITTIIITLLGIVTLLYSKNLIFFVIVFGAIAGIVIVNIRRIINKSRSLKERG